MTLFLHNFLLTLFLAVAVNSCTGGESSDKHEEQTRTRQSVETTLKYSFSSPSENQTFTTGQKIDVALQSSDTSDVDSIKLTIEANTVTLKPAMQVNTSISTSDSHIGPSRIKLRTYLRGGKIQDSSVPVILLSDIKPKNFSYRVIKEYPHDKTNYTQGLEYDQGYFYEGTGQYGESSLKKIVYNTGETVKSRKLDSELFGEGITVLNGKIYQITYRNQVGFVYDIETFEQIRKIYYQNKEGWGLTNNGKEIIMSDGTNVLYFMDPEYFSVLRKVEVYDNVQPVDSLNELEYINGSIYANRYLTEQIIIIDPQTGKVTGKADLSGILKKEHSLPSTDVFNGIAWDKEGKRLFVTGKYWPRIYHVELVPR